MVTSTARDLSAGKDAFELNSYIAERTVYLYNITLMSKEEVNIITLDVSTSKDGERFKPSRTVGAFQIPASAYLYMFTKGNKPENFIRIDLRQTRTAWTPEELDISLLRILPPLAESPKANPRIKTDEYLLFADERMKYERIQSGIDSATFALKDSCCTR